MLYQCSGVQARVAPAPWGPWSEPTELLGQADKPGCRLVMIPQGCGDRRDYWPTRHPNGQFVRGGFYAPYVLNRYTTDAGGNAEEPQSHDLLDGVHVESIRREHHAHDDRERSAQHTLINEGRCCHTF